MQTNVLQGMRAMLQRLHQQRRETQMRYITQKTPANRFTVIDTRDGSQRLFPTDLINAATFAGTLNKQEAAFLAANPWLRTR
jgi:hypothetical protein